MAKILLSLSNAIKDGNAWRPVCFYEQLINVLTEEGNDVLLYIPNKFHSYVFCGENDMFPNVDEDKLVEEIKAFNPELVIAFNNATYHKILDVTDCRIVVWDADLVPFWNQVDLIKNNLDRYVFFSHIDYYRRKEQEIFGFKDEQSMVFPQGTSMRNTHAEKTANISFIGTNFGTRSFFVDLIKKHSGEPEFLSLLHRIRDDFVFDKDALMRNLTDESLKNDLDAVNSADIPYFFPGEERLLILLALSDLGLNLYAQGDWIAQARFLPSLAACDTRQNVYSFADNERVYNQSKICLNINHKAQAAHGMSWRVPDIMATGGCLVSSYSPYIKEKFKNYVDIPMFDNEYDAHALCQKILNDENWRADIVAGSNTAIEKEGRWIHSLKKAEDFLNIKLTDLGKKGVLTVLEPAFLTSEKNIPSSVKVGLKNKIRYKLWRHLNKKKFVSLWEYKLHKHLSKRLVKKGIIPSYTPLVLKKDELIYKLTVKNEELVESVVNKILNAKNASPGQTKAFPPVQKRRTGNYKKLVSSCGFYYSGSGVIVGLMDECDNVSVFGFTESFYSASTPSNKGECCFLRDSSLFPFADAFHNGNKMDRDLAIKRFIYDIYESYDNKGFSYECLPEIYNDEFLRLSMTLLRSTVRFDDKTLSTMENSRLPCPFVPPQDNAYFNGCSIVRGKSSQRYSFYEFKDISGELFDKYVSDYIRGYLHLFDSKEILFGDGLINVKYLDQLNRHLPDTPVRQICVWRDPRDQFVAAFRNDFRLLPRNIDGFVSFYTETFNLKSVLENPNPNRLVLRFEDIVLKYDETREKIFDFIGEDLSHHVAPKSIFNPAISAMNIGAYKTFIDQDFIRRIEERLGDYCYYPEKENLSEEAWAMLRKYNYD